MKKCSGIKDLILTDYIDGELVKDAAGQVESHLLGCPECRAFLKEIKDNTAIPFHQSVRQPVPGVLWDMVRQNIENEGQAPGLFSDFIEKIKGLLVIPRLVPIFASLALMLLAGSVTLNVIHFQQAKDKDQGEYLVSLIGPTGSSLQAENNDPGTPIERYFL